MASLRILKKDINCLTEDLISECFVYQHFHPDFTDEKLFAVLQKLTDKRNELVGKINNLSGMKDLTAHKKLLQEVRAEIPELADVLEGLKKN